MAAEKCGMCPFEAMDHLWFHHIVISSKSPNYSSKNTPQISVIVSNQQISSSPSAVASSQVENKRQESDHVQETTTTTSTTKSKDIPTNLYLVSRETRSNPSSPTSKQERLKKSMSCCSSLGDLELEEVKGFMDLGFVFKKQNLSSHVISLIPGLQRINSQEQDLGTQIDEEKRGPYLSDSWLVKMPDSPLIRLRISRVCNDSEKVKEHLKDWARTVAAAIHQES